ncbi:MAG: hypothetical protein IKT56_06900 [Clostridia bacterium]|nr:hypothetical protein [Clostridia bacterium]
MKSYENFDNNFFIKVICVIAALVLVFVIAATAVGLLTQDKVPASDNKDAETFVFNDFSNDTEPILSDSEETTEAPLPTDTIEQSENIDTEHTDTEVDTEDSESSTEYEEPPSPPSTVLEESEDMGQEYIDSLTFLCDSSTRGLRSYAMLKDGKSTEQIWATQSGTLRLDSILDSKIIYPKNNKEMTVAEAVALDRPEYLVITLGLEGGVTTLDETSFKQNYTALIDTIMTESPDTKIILQSIFPVAAKFTNENKLNNSVIDKANIWVREIAESTCVRYLDTQSILKDEAGALNEKYDNGGTGTNLDAEGFSAVLEYIRTHAYK